MDLKEFEEQFESELENGLDHAEWYEKEVKWLIKQVKKLEWLKEAVSVCNEQKITPQELAKMLNE